MKNWAGNIEFSTTTIHQPESIEALQTLVRQADKIKVIGTRHSFNRIADSEHALVSLENLNRCKRHIWQLFCSWPLGSWEPPWLQSGKPRLPEPLPFAATQPRWSIPGTTPIPISLRTPISSSGWPKSWRKEPRCRPPKWVPG